MLLFDNSFWCIKQLMFLFVLVAAERKQRALFIARLDMERTKKINHQKQILQQPRLQRKEAIKFHKVEEGDDQFEAHPTEVVERVREIYYQWCNVYSKDVDADRFKVFTTNFLYMEALANESGDVIEINKWYDCTEEEYNNGLKAELEEEAPELVDVDDEKSEENDKKNPKTNSAIDQAFIAKEEDKVQDTGPNNCNENKQNESAHFEWDTEEDDSSTMQIEATLEQRDCEYL